MLPLNAISWRSGFVNEIGVEDVELVALDDFWRRIIVIVVCLIVLVPFVAFQHSVEIPGLSRTIQM